MTAPVDQTPFDRLSEKDREYLWDIYMDMEKSALVEQCLTAFSEEELQQHLKELRDMEKEDLEYGNGPPL